MRNTRAASRMADVLIGRASWRLEHGDALTLLRALPPDSVDACITDPPYGLEFMGVAWDTMRPRGTPRTPNTRGDFGSREHPRTADEAARVQAKKTMAFEAFSATWAREVHRVLKPGAHLLAFGGPRTYHRMACAVEDVGFEIRDQLMWIYGQGFPKSRDIGKALRASRAACGEDRAWEGWGTGLKPAHEPIILARKALRAPVVATNVREFGVGALNIDASRIPGPSADGCWGSSNATVAAARTFNRSPGMRDYRSREHPGGRWPANLTFSHDPGCTRRRCAAGCPVRLLDAQAGWRASGLMRAGTRRQQDGGYHGGFPERATAHDTYGDAGGASRFFAVFEPFRYVPKASRAERDAGVEDLPPRPLRRSSGTKNLGSVQAEGTRRHAANHHPTVKPVDVMRWLVRLVTPPGGVVLDPFCGSGTTGIAAACEQMRFLGMERERDYVRIARRRIAHAASRASATRSREPAAFTRRSTSRASAADPAPARTTSAPSQRTPRSRGSNAPEQPGLIR